MRLEHSDGIRICISTKELGNFFSANSISELDSMKYFGTITLRAFGGYDHCYYPTLSFIGMPT